MLMLLLMGSAAAAEKGERAKAGTMNGLRYSIVPSPKGVNRSGYIIRAQTADGRKLKRVVDKNATWHSRQQSAWRAGADPATDEPVYRVEWNNQTRIAQNPAVQRRAANATARRWSEQVKEKNAAEQRERALWPH
jgi:hypothetical protein